MTRLPPETIATIKALRKIGHPYTEIVKQTKVARSTVSRHAKGLHKNRKAGAPKKYSSIRFKTLRAEGLSYAEIAKRTGVSTSVIHRHLKAV